MSNLSQLSLASLIDWLETLRVAGEDKRKAQAFSLAAILLAAASTFLLLRISYAQAAFQTTMSKRDEGESVMVA